MNLSIITACIPSLKAVIDMFWSGALMFTVPTQYTSSAHDGSGGITNNRSKTNNDSLASRLARRAFKSSSSQNHSQNDNTYQRSTDKSQTRPNFTGQPQHHTAVLERSESQISLRDPNAILRTVEYDVYPTPAKPRGEEKGGIGEDGLSQSSSEQDQRLGVGMIGKGV